MKDVYIIKRACNNERIRLRSRKIWGDEMSELYFVRHGESEWNVADKICGQTDVELTQKGHEQACITAQEFVNQGIKADIILCSPLKRAKSTAEHISNITGIDLKVEPRLIEQNFGIWEGHTPRKSAEFTVAKQQFVTSFGGGESMLKLAQRIYNLLDEIRQDKEHTYILVAHNGIARVVKSYFSDMTNEEYANYGVNNCVITKFTFSD